ncbi:MAG: hypothetical protein F9K40_09060 [Kofleriaceae bacterium]|nr:MAG: hypothetical protein F9K40_09060 [Kofleriaceae bacterium]MBZ0230894.1 hypothetical protein [Kofleriaceae bacterium]
MSLRLVLSAAVALLVGCKDPPPVFQDAAPTDAGIDAEIDAPVDAPTPLPAYELTGGARNVRGTRYAADVQIGHGIGQQPAAGNGKTIEGNAAVKP